MRDFLIGFLVMAVLLVIGLVIAALVERVANKKTDKIYAGTINIHKNDEAIDGQVLLTKNLWAISELKEVTFKIKILPGEPGEWENKK